MVGFGALVMIAGVGGAVAVRYVLGEVNNVIAQPDLLGNDVAQGNSIKGAINVLLVGVDTRPTGNIGSHSDTIIIAHIPASHDRMYLVSIPRDTSATIPSDKATRFSGGSYKINASFTFGSQNGGGEQGGFQLLAKTLKQSYGLAFNGGAIVNFSGFQDIVDELGGVDLNVDETTTSIHHGYLLSDPKKIVKPYKINPNTGVPSCSNKHVTFDSNPLKCAIAGTAPVQYKKGPHHFTAYQALDFVRCRDGLVGTDYARQRHQQQFIKAVMNEAYSKGFSDPLKLTSFMKAISKAFEFSGGGVSLNDWIFTLKGLTPNAIITIKINDGQYAHYTGPAPDDRQTLTADSRKLLDDVISDNVDQFVETHQSWVAS
jgi:LCP family protein required for cell wall assembly